MTTLVTIKSVHEHADKVVEITHVLVSSDGSRTPGATERIDAGQSSREIAIHDGLDLMIKEVSR